MHRTCSRLVAQGLTAVSLLSCLCRANFAGVPRIKPEIAMTGVEKKEVEGQGANAGNPSEIAEIKKLENDRLAAGVRKDVDAVAAATADDYMQIDVDGNVLGKPATLQRIKSSYAQLQSNPVDDVVVRIYGNTAVLTAQARPNGILDGKAFGGAVRYTRVYLKRGGRWQVVLFQQTRVAADKQ